MEILNGLNYNLIDRQTDRQTDTLILSAFADTLIDEKGIFYPCD